MPGFRYVIAGLLLLATMINYADRSMLSVVSIEIRKELGLSESDYGQIVSFFMGAYAVMYALSGPICDRLGTKRSFALFVTVWSLAAVGHATAIGKWSLSAWRFMLGLGEPGNWPAAAKAVAEWFPPHQRALGIGIFNAGSSLGSMLAPPVVGWLTIHYGWRYAFVLVGGLGFIWLIAWLLIYDPPHKSRFITRGEYEYLKDKVRPPDEAKPAPISVREFFRVFRMRECYSLVAARFFTDPVIYFITFWLPEYLRKERGFDLSMVAMYAWVPFLFGDIGYVFGGWLSGHLMQRGWKMQHARSVLLFAAGCITPVAMFATRVSEAWMAIAITCCVTFAHALWVSNLLTLPTDLFPASRVGTATGLSGMGGAVGGLLANLATGYVVQRYSYQPIFLIAGLVHPLAFCIVFVLLLRGWMRQPAQSST